MALQARAKASGTLVHHSDRGVQYCSWKYADLLRNHDITISMTQSGDPSGNAVAERVLRTLKEDFGLRALDLFHPHKLQLKKASITIMRSDHMLRWDTSLLTRRICGQGRSH